MRASVVICVVAAATATARAEDPPAAGTEDRAEDRIAKARDLVAAGDFVHARDELLAAYQAEPRPELLFALGQVEYNLEHYAQAIAYYEQFVASDPAPDQAALAQQAIGAARGVLSHHVAPPPPAPPPPAPPPPPHREFDGLDRSLVALGGLAIASGGGLLYFGRHLSQDRSGTLAQYDRRIHEAHEAQWIAGGAFAAGALAIGVALVRWRVHLVETTIEVQPTAGGATVLLEHPL